MLDFLFAEGILGDYTFIIDKQKGVVPRLIMFFLSSGAFDLDATLGTFHSVIYGGTRSKNNTRQRIKVSENVKLAFVCIFRS